jgi:hypothetical protein
VVSAFISMVQLKEMEIQTLLDKKVSKALIAKIMEISRTTLYNFIHTRGL